MKGRPGCLTIYLHTDICLLKLQHWQKLDRNDGEASRYLQWKPNGSLFSSGFNSEISLIHFVELRQMAFSVGSQTFSQFQRQPAANMSKSGGAAAARRNHGGEPEFFSVMETIAVHIFSQEKRSVLFEMEEYFAVSIDQQCLLDKSRGCLEIMPPTPQGFSSVWVLEVAPCQIPNALKSR